MAETETLGRVESGEEAESPEEVRRETQLSIKVMRDPDLGVPIQRIFYFTIFLLALWVVLSLAVTAIRNWI